MPILIPLLAAALMLVFWRRTSLQRRVNVIGASALLASAVALLAAVRERGILVVRIGDWPAPFGIVLVADLFSAVMVLMAALMGMAVAVYSLQNIDRRRERFFYYPLLHILLMGVCGAHLTGDIFNLYVWFEVMLMSSFVLLALGGERAQLEGAIKYVTLNLVSSAIFLAAVGILYGMVGTLNMADLAVRLANLENPRMATMLSLMFFVSFGVKAALFPFFFWLPASYHTPPVAVSAIFAGLLTKVGVYTLVRVYTLIFRQEYDVTGLLMLGAAGLTMLIGVLGAAAQGEVRRILSFHIISQIGYMIMGLGLAMVLIHADRPELATLALGGAVFYIVHHILVKTNLFLISGILQRIRGTLALDQLGGLYRAYPLLGVLFLIPAMSLAGMPPLSGFFSKFILVRAGLEAGQYLIVAVALAVSLLTLFSMTKIWAEAFWKADPAPAARPGRHACRLRTAPPFSRPGLGWMAAPCIVLACMTLSFGIFAQPLFRLATEAAAQLLDTRAYIEAVDQHGHILPAADEPTP
jgi:multicomponent Na+:H+ antiporter subunit D